MMLFRKINEAFGEAGITFVLIGGHAINHYGVSRNTADVDFMIVSGDKDKAVKALDHLGYHEDYSSDLFARCIHTEPAIMDVDLVFVDKETLAKITKAAVYVTIEGCEILIPDLDHLIAMKLHSLRYTPARLLKDGSDIVALLRESHRTPDDIKEMCDRFGSEDVMNKIRFLYECEENA